MPEPAKRSRQRLPGSLDVLLWGCSALLGIKIITGFLGGRHLDDGPFIDRLPEVVDVLRRFRDRHLRPGVHARVRAPGHAEAHALAQHRLERVPEQALYRRLTRLPGPAAIPVLLVT